MDCSMPGSPVLHYLSEFAQISEMSTFYLHSPRLWASSGIEMIEESAWAIFNLNSQKRSKLKQTRKGRGSNNLRKKKIIT